jgi:hypothetical protein
MEQAAPMMVIKLRFIPELLLEFLLLFFQVRSESKKTQPPASISNKMEKNSPNTEHLLVICSRPVLLGIASGQVQNILEVAFFVATENISAICWVW